MLSPKKIKAYLLVYSSLKVLLWVPKYCFGIIYFYVLSHLLNYQFAKKFRIKKLCRLLAHIDQQSPWAFIFIIIAFYFLWFWQNTVFFGLGLTDNEWGRSRVRVKIADLEDDWGQDWASSGHYCRSGMVIIRARRPRSIADVCPSSRPSCRQSLPDRRPDSGSVTC